MTDDWRSYWNGPPTFLQPTGGTVTGRLSGSNPRTAEVPRTDAPDFSYLKRERPVEVPSASLSASVAQATHIDYSQVERRMLALAAAERKTTMRHEGLTNLERFVAESFRLEGEEATAEDVRAHLKFLERPLTIPSVETLVRALSRDTASLRLAVGVNVAVGTHTAPYGGPAIGTRLSAILEGARGWVDGWPDWSPFEVHVAYETLHPFTDYNGRSGRAVWLWQHHARGGGTPRSFLVGFYHDALRWNDARARRAG